MKICLVGNVINSGYIAMQFRYLGQPADPYHFFLDISQPPLFMLHTTITVRFLKCQSGFVFSINFSSDKGWVPETQMLDEIGKTSDLRNNHT